MMNLGNQTRGDGQHTHMNESAPAPIPSSSSPWSAVSVARMARTTSVWASSTWWTWLIAEAEQSRPQHHWRGPPHSPLVVAVVEGWRQWWRKTEEPPKSTYALSALGKRDRCSLG